MQRRRRNIGARAGKQPQKNIQTNVTESKYEAGGAKLKRKKGGIVRRPRAPIRYKHKKSVT
jgi:hypothetical protein